MCDNFDTTTMLYLGTSFYLDILTYLDTLLCTTDLYKLAHFVALGMILRDHIDELHCIAGLLLYSVLTD